MIRTRSARTFGTNAFGGALGEWSRNFHSIRIVIVNFLEHRAKAATTVRRNQRVMIFAGSIQSFREGNIFAEIVFGGVFKTFQQTIIVAAVKIESLMPCDFAAIAEVRQAELRVLLVASAFLALAGFVDEVMLQPAIARAVHIITQRALEHRAVIAENADGHHRFDGGSVPI